MTESIKNRVAIIGVGCTKFGDNFDLSYEEMAAEAAFQALNDARIEPERIEAAWLGTFSPGQGHGKASVSLADAVRLYDKPITRVENYCATGTDAFRNAAMAVAAGIYDVALVLGVEKLKDRATRGLASEGNHAYQHDGSTAPGIFALSATRYLERFKVGRDSLAKVAVKNHHNGTLNPKAHFQIEVTEQQVLKAPMVAYPFGLFDCCPTTDGAAAAVICRADMAKQFRDDYVMVKGIGLAVTSGLPWFEPGYEFTGFQATRTAAQAAYAMAGIQDPLKEIDLAEVHDCFTWTELSNYEDLGFCKKGEGAHFIGEGRSSLSGDLPVNTSGGLKSSGHPIGASGVRMIYEITTQLRGQAGARQVQDPSLGLVHNLGGPGSVSCVVILGQP
ncbi:MAG TPA: acetyl-CoA acetyltransferase [Pyrinomonadaceae bacterium]|nr:acetyl-CoA acetyltransferase [Pyrinomonadaceae bacterium]